jgi:UDP-glucuronate decarboxylase
VLVGLRPDDRVLILGASGWFGKTLQQLLEDRVEILKLASTSRQDYEDWNLQRVRAFAPTMVVSLAFLPRSELAVLGEQGYRIAALDILDQFALAAEMPSVRSCFLASSGTAVMATESVHGALKALSEQRALELVSDQRNVVVGRVYSVSGPLVTRPHEYAFSDLILQAFTGQIVIRAQHQVWRRYVSVEDFLQVSLGLMLRGDSGVLESGGDLIEIADLAKEISKVVNPVAQIHVMTDRVGDPDIYASDNESWVRASESLGLSPANLRAQIRATAGGLAPT